MEPAIEPDLVICDPHHHLWDTSSHGMTPYLVDELVADHSTGHNIVSSVFVECSWALLDDGPAHLRPVGETRAVAALAPGSPIGAIIPMADLTLPTDLLEETLAAHRDAANGLFRGIRDRVASDPTAPLVSMPDSLRAKLPSASFRRGLTTLAQHDLSFDAWALHPQIPDIIAVARAIPDLRIVLDHLGAPLGTGHYADDRAAVLTAWRASMTELATCPNVHVKLGGIGMVIFGMALPRPESGASATSDEVVARWGVEIRFVIDTFGPSRCMFESNFPVDRAGIDYVVLWNAFKKISAGYSPAERARLFHDTAVEFYGVGNATGEVLR